MKHLLTLWLSLGLLVWSGAPASAQFFDENHPELEWETITTEHFYVHFHQGESRTPQLIAKIAEEVYEPLTKLYKYQPSQRIHWIVRDHDDFSNAAAYYYEDRIEFYAPPADFMLRGSSNWLRNTVVHEFTHSISLGAARKMSQRVPGLFFQTVAYEEESREDVLYGYPNVILSQAFAGSVIPGWFAEGTAQHGSDRFGFDRYDAHRDMILRTRALNDNLLSFEEMSHFGKSSIGSESVYNQGYALVGYIIDKYGEEKLEEIMDSMTRFFATDFSSGIKRALGVDGKTLHTQWKQTMTEKYRREMATILDRQVVGKIVESGSAGNFYPTWSPDGTEFAFLSTGRSDYLSQTSLYRHNLSDGKRSLLKPWASTTISWNRENNRIAFARNRRTKNGSRFNDLYVYDRKSGDEKRLTKAKRLAYPTFSPDGNTILCVTAGDGMTNLATLNPESGDLQYLTNYDDGRQLYGGQWSPDGKTIAFASSMAHGRDIALLNTENGDVTYIMDGPEDTRDPVFSHDGRYLYYSSDVTGIFNIYRMDLASRTNELLTNVPGGAFMPAVNADGDLLYSVYTNDGFHIALLESPKPLAAADARYRPEYPSTVPTADYDDSVPPALTAEKYKDHFNDFMFAPRLMFDYGKPKIGFTGFGSTVLGDMEIIAAAMVNPDFDLDIVGIFEYNKLKPTLFAELYHLTRHTKDEGDEIKLSLLEGDFGARMRMWAGSQLQLAYVHDRYGSAIDFLGDDNNPTFFFRSEYHIGHDFRATWNWNGVRRSSDSEINPSRGRDISLRLDRYINKFLVDFNLEQSIDIEVYKTYQFSSMELDYKEYLPLSPYGDALTLGVRAAGLTENPDDFYYHFAGGLAGMKGYSYFSMQGSRIAIGSATWRRPLIKDMSVRIGPWYFTQLYGAVRFDYGNAWEHGRLPLDDFKKDIDLELRLDAFSWYNYPTRIAMHAAYGFDKFEGSRGERGGGEWRYYLTWLFEYLK
jgi:Tol biopolymer transport system component